MTWHIEPETLATVRNDRREVQCVATHPDIAARIVADHGAVAELAELKRALHGEGITIEAHLSDKWTAAQFGGTIEP